MKLIKIWMWMILIVLSLLIITENVNAFGISPGRNTINYQNEILEADGSFNILNKENKDFNAVIYLEGDLKEYITLDKTEISLSKNEEKKTVNYKINLPNNVDEPGDHDVKIIVSEVSSVIGSKDAYTIGVKVELIHQVRIKVPYPGKYAKLTLTSIEEDGNIKFITSVYNLGKEEINNAKAEVFVYNINDELVKEIKAESKKVEVGYKRDLIGTWELADQGNYKIKVKVNYDGIEKEVEGRLTVGDFFARLLDVFVEKGFRLGGIAKFNVLTENAGNTLIENLYSQLILNSEGKDIADIKSANIDLESGEREKMFIFWDTGNIDIGKYEGKLVLSYQDKFMEKQVNLFVSEDDIKVEIVGLTGAVVGTNVLIKGAANWLLAGVFVIIIGFIIWRRFKKKKQPSLKKNIEQEKKVSKEDNE